LWSGLHNRFLITDFLVNKAKEDLKFAAHALKSLNSSVEMMAPMSRFAESGWPYLVQGPRIKHINRAAFHVPVRKPLQSGEK